MRYSDLLKASKTGEKSPTLQATTWKTIEKKRLKKGLCVSCGEQSADKCSYLCKSCQAQQSMIEIQDEIKLLKKQILSG